MTTVSSRFWALVRIALAVMTLGCATYRGTARYAQPSTLARSGDWWMVKNFPLVLQEKNNDCGSAALASVLRFWGHSATPQSIEAAIGRGNSRLRAGDIAHHAQKFGLRSYVFYGTMTDVAYELRRGRPVIVGLGKEYAEKKALSHYEVVVGYEPKKKLVLLLDPGRGWQVDTLEGFGEEWARSKGVAIVAFLPEKPVASVGDRTSGTWFALIEGHENEAPRPARSDGALARHAGTSRDHRYLLAGHQ